MPPMATEIAMRIPGTIPENERNGGGDRLVVPSALHKNFPEAVRKELMTLGAFMETVKILLHNY